MHRTLLTPGKGLHPAARRIFGVAEGELDPALRARAKIVNFGVMYGMGARSLHVGRINVYVYWFLFGIVFLLTLASWHFGGKVVHHE